MNEDEHVACCLPLKVVIDDDDDNDDDDDDDDDDDELVVDSLDVGEFERATRDVPERAQLLTRRVNRRQEAMHATYLLLDTPFDSAGNARGNGGGIAVGRGKHALNEYSP
jgi:hypothetical protein